MELTIGKLIPIYSPKGKKLRGSVQITHIDVERNIITVDAVPKGTKKGDQITCQS